MKIKFLMPKRRKKRRAKNKPTTNDQRPTTDDKLATNKEATKSIRKEARY